MKKQPKIKVDQINSFEFNATIQRFAVLARLDVTTSFNEINRLLKFFESELIALLTKRRVTGAQVEVATAGGMKLVFVRKHRDWFFTGMEQIMPGSPKADLILTDEQQRFAALA